jgi:hypothetical protein
MEGQMPDDTDDANMERIQLEFLQALGTIMPDRLADAGIVAACSQLITSYASGPHDAMLWIVTLASDLRDYYSTETGGECMCDSCTANRKAHAN